MKPTIEDYIEVCKINAKNRDKWDNNWEENNVSNELAYFFQDENIFKDFLRRIIKEPTYSPDKEHFQLMLDENKIQELKFEEMRFPQTRICINTKDGKKEIDLLLKGKNFLCVIENKFGSSEHGRQCHYYKEYILDKCKTEQKEYPICIYIDTEHSGKKVSENVFEKDNRYSGYYLAWYGKDILPVLENYTNHKILGKNIEKFCNFLKEVTWGSIPVIQMEKIKRREKIIKCLKYLINANIECNDYYDEIYINGEYFIQRYQYLEYSRKENKELKECLMKKLKEFYKK